MIQGKLYPYVILTVFNINNRKTGIPDEEWSRTIRPQPINLLYNKEHIQEQYVHTLACASFFKSTQINADKSIL